MELVTQIVTDCDGNSKNGVVKTKNVNGTNKIDGLNYADMAAWFLESSGWRKVLTWRYHSWRAQDWP